MWVCRPVGGARRERRAVPRRRPAAAAVGMHGGSPVERRRRLVFRRRSLLYVHDGDVEELAAEADGDGDGGHDGDGDGGHGPVRNLTAMANVATLFRHAMIRGCSAMNSPESEETCEEENEPRLNMAMPWPASERMEMDFMRLISHLRTAPSIGEAAVGRVAQGTKVLAEGGHDRIFRYVFSAPPDEQLRRSYACYLSTSAGPRLFLIRRAAARHVG
uniref:Uncharacterized protein n=1 Tax=Oryza glumipatula TaxID=40148 RepID=A0A0D9ZQ31_9ORYZ